jgi:hypothetical protein
LKSLFPTPILWISLELAPQDSHFDLDLGLQFSKEQIAQVHGTVDILYAYNFMMQNNETTIAEIFP